MYKTIVFLLLTALTFNSTTAEGQDTDPNMGIIPAPVSVKKADGQFVLSQETVLYADSNTKAVSFFTEYLQNRLNLRTQLKIGDAGSAGNSIVLTAKGTENLPEQGYRLTITPQQIIIAGKGSGLFYGIQTVLQLIPADRTASIKIPCATIEDYPRFGYRGLMLDVCRHFFSVEFVKKMIDVMAYYKLNNFHWHLTDDQGWRIEIKKYPRLTEIGSQRAQTVIGNYHDRTPQQFDNTPYGGYYTQDQIRDVVKYAADRYINIVPEIEMPGHCMAALAAYPELSCDPSKTYKTYETWGVVKDVYCPSDKTFDFLQDVLTEVMDLFPSKYIHIGGDEVPKDAWKNSAFCQKLMKKLKLKNEEELQSYFIQRMEKFVNSKGRSIIGWDEILEGGLSPNATVMSWRGEAGGIAAAKQNHNVIMTPGSGGLYLDHAQAKTGEPVGIGGFTPLSKTYSYNPTPAALTPDQQKYIEGVQANLWTEYIPTEAKAEYMYFPRALALAEVAWTPLVNKNFKDFSEVRLPSHLAWLDRNDYDYRVPEAIGACDTITFGSQMNVQLKPSVAGAKVYYTIDGYTPRETDIEYRMPMTYNVPSDQYRDLETIVITPSGKRSRVTHSVMYNRPALAPVAYQGNTQGLKYQLLQGTFDNTGDFKDAAIIDSGVVKSFNLAELRKNKPSFGVIYNGYLRIDTDGVYLFSIKSDDGSVLTIDDQPVVNNDGKHPLMEQGGAVALQKGYHKFTLKYFDIGAVRALKVYMTILGKPKGELSPESMFN
ncbi:family 20 glycosylhydrolase [Mucilaginibacter ginsenosidivorans]|uniref:beta-N-acetylhexosaminidase n=1 Tax=Mucilaginibacter ginsenosidivorans TaxID=398053 RepID=A0A5B8UZN1_9SPHI|nr:family 20 glycosylhydrolase [Mucilaginibacter ginsenosidivorans]QEC64677.1 family 20 glycosylhydrolase [Mucilaginibacter ginsenosidivorans]